MFNIELYSTALYRESIVYSFVGLMFESKLQVTYLCKIHKYHGRHPWNKALLNSLWPIGAIWWYRTWLTLVQGMTHCLMAPSHCLNQYWLIMRGILWHSLLGSFIEKDTRPWNVFKNTDFKLQLDLPGAIELMFPWFSEVEVTLTLWFSRENRLGYEWTKCLWN